jgi:hypothetical protein
LIAPLVSESFTNDATTGTVSYPTSGAAGTSTAAATTLTVSYDAGSNSYLISVPGRSQTFRPGDRDAAQSSAASTVYVRTSGSTTDSLTLLNPSTTAGPLAYRYVGAGYWQRTVESSSTINGSFDAFTYGVKTPDAATPRTGAASYRIELLGIVGLPNDVRSIGGNGTLLADFSVGLIRMQGTATEYDSAGFAINPYMAFFSQVPLSSANNSFTGAFRYYSDTSRPDPFDGTIAGRFYGPGAEEVGGAFSVRRADGASAVGTITGARGGTGTNLSLTTLAFDQIFPTASNSIRYLRMANGNATDAVAYDGNLMFGNQLTYAAATGSWNFQPDGSSPGDLTLFTPADLNAALSNTRFTVYQRTGDDGNIFRLSIYKPGPGNDQLALTYAGFGYWERITPIAGTGGAERTNFDPFIYALRTPALAIPTTGTASYQGILFGRATGSGFDRFYTIGGTSRFELNFGTHSFVATLSPVGIEGVSGTSVDFGNFTFTGNSLVDMLGKDSGGDTRLRGYLAGPNADEIAGEFLFGVKDPLNPALGDVSIGGVTVAKRCPAGC